MTAFKDLSVTDLIGACNQWRGYLTETLGFDHTVKVSAGVDNGRGQIWLLGHDKFQEHVRYEKEVGRCSCLQEFNLDDDWDYVCNLVWERLKKVMLRDERELRYGLQQMSGALEHAPSFTSAVGKMFAERISAVRDEVGKHLIEYRRPVAEPAE